MNKTIPKDHRFKTIIVATVAAALIIAISFWAITSALNSANDKKAETTASEGTKPEETAKTTTTEPVGSTPTSPSAEYTAPAPAITNAAPAVSNNLPTTGPSDVLISAFALGLIASLILLNINLVQKQNF